MNQTDNMGNEEQMELIAKTFKGLEGVLAHELETIGASNIRPGKRVVAFTGDKRMMYKANFCLRTAVRVLKPIMQFKAVNADEVYDKVSELDWEKYLSLDKSFAVDATVYSEMFRHSMFVTYRVKDAIADYFTRKYGKRPSVKLSNPDIYLNIHISDDECTLSLDSSGESLHKRGYRQGSVKAPINEVLAAGMIMMTGWDGDCDFVDPMCGSGTIPIEAALIARNIAPGVFRQHYAFERWADFDAGLFEEIFNDDSQERDFEHKIYAYDIDPVAIATTKSNIKAAGVSKDIITNIQDIKDFDWQGGKAIMVTNPPYGERLTFKDLGDLYACIGERLKHKFTGNTAWIISSSEEAFDTVGLKSSETIDLYNGALECKFKKYETFSGKYNDYKAGIAAQGGRDDDRRDRERPSWRNDDKEERRGFGNRDRRNERRDDRPRKDFRGDRDDDRRGFGDRGRRDERRDDRPRRDFRGDRDDDRRGFGDRGRRDERRDDRPRRDFRGDRDDDRRGFGDRGRRDERRDDRPRRDFRGDRDDDRRGFGNRDRRDERRGRGNDRERGFGRGGDRKDNGRYDRRKDRDWQDND